MGWAGPTEVTVVIRHLIVGIGAPEAMEII